MENDYDNSKDNDDDGPHDYNHCKRNTVQPVYGTNNFIDLIRHIQDELELNTVLHIKVSPLS